MRYFLEISYKGTAYEGFQVQPGKDTIQGRLNEVLSRVLNSEIRVSGAGRTDAGVHALQSFVHFDSDTALPENIVYRLNKMLPADIAAKRLFPVADTAHARYDAVSRAYSYRIHFEKNPFLTGLSYYYPYPAPDIEAMKKALPHFKNFDDYAVLSRFNPDNKTTLCKVTQAELTFDSENKCLEFQVEANRFLHNMVRRMTGALLAIGRQAMSSEQLRDSLEKKIPLPVNETAPPEGLYLTRVLYPFIKNEKT